MNPQRISTIEERELSPSFNCYSSQTLTSISIAKVIHEDEDFEFSFIPNDDVSSPIDSTVFPVFNDEVKPKTDPNHEIDASFAITDPLHNLFIDDVDETSSYSSSSSSSSSSSLSLSEEINELDNIPSGTFCVWRPKTNNGDTSPVMSKCKKSSSTGSGSKRWTIRYLLKRSNSEGKEPMLMLSSKQKRSSGEVSKQKRSSGVHERFYVERRAEKEEGMRKSYLPYRKDLVGLSFASVNGFGKMLPF